MINNSLISRSLMLEKTIRNNITCNTFRQSVRFHGRNSNLNKPFQYKFINGPKIFSKVPSTSKNQENIYRCCGTQERRVSLMNFPVVLKPTILHAAQVAYFNYFVLKKLDESFVMEEFVESTRVALEVVSFLLSELRLDELDGLVTKECKEELEKNVKSFRPSERLDLAVKGDDIFSSRPFKVEIIRDESNEDRTFLQITVVHHIIKNMSQIFKSISLKELSQSSKSYFSVYNSRFIKEVTNGVDDKWIINAINFYKVVFD